MSVEEGVRGCVCCVCVYEVVFHINSNPDSVGVSNMHAAYFFRNEARPVAMTTVTTAMVFFLTIFSDSIYGELSRFLCHDSSCSEVGIRRKIAQQ